jgi:hypothetical protein
MKQKNKNEIRARHQLASVAVRCGLQLTNFQKKKKKKNVSTMKSD